MLLWFHGGAFVLCNTATHARLMSSMGVAGDARVLSVEYPLAPDQGVYEDMADAADRAYAWLVSERGGNVDRKDVVVGGDSAGGHLALALAQRLAASSGRGRGRPRRPGVALALAGPGTRLAEHGGVARSGRRFGGLPASGGGVDEQRGGARVRRRPKPERFDDAGRTITPVSSRRVAHAGRSMPPCLIQYGGIEAPASEANGLAEVASAAGWDDVTLEAFPEMPHVFQVFDSVSPEGAAAISSVGRFMKKDAAARP